MHLRFLSVDDAAAVDQALLSPDQGVSIEQLTELNRLACAQTVFECYPPYAFTSVLVAAGPGVQGFNGLVAARHLRPFGCDVQVWLSLPSGEEEHREQEHQEPVSSLIKQLQALHIPLLEPDEDTYMQCDVVLDALLGTDAHHPPLHTCCYKKSPTYWSTIP